MIINFIVTGLIFFTYWFFFMKKEEVATKVNKRVTIKVDGGYSPSVIEIPVGQPVILEFYRTDPSSCLEEVMFPDFGIGQFLPYKKKTEVVISPTKTGEYQFHCGMNMYSGKMKVVEV